MPGARRGAEGRPEHHAVYNLPTTLTVQRIKESFASPETLSFWALPGFIANEDGFKAKGVDAIAMTSVNDHHVLSAWSKATGADGKVSFLADGNGDFAKATGLEFDASGGGLGVRSKRYSMLVEDGVVKKLNIEESPGKVDLSGAEHLLAEI